MTINITKEEIQFVDEQLAQKSFPLPLKALRMLKLIKERQSLIVGAYYNLNRIEAIDRLLEE